MFTGGFHGFSLFKLLFRDYMWIFMVFHGSRLVFCEYRWIFIGFQGSKLVFVIVGEFSQSL